MNNRLVIKKLFVQGSFLKILHPYLELLKTEVLISTSSKY